MLSAQFPCWIYHGQIKDHTRAQALFGRLYDHLFAAFIHERSPFLAWTNRIFADTRVRVALRDIIRHDLLSRRTDSVHVFILLSSCSMLRSNNRFTHTMGRELEAIDRPVAWYIKALQREVCMRHDPQEQPTTAGIALDHAGCALFSFQGCDY